jgi:hypothetical protein
VWSRLSIAAQVMHGAERVTGQWWIMNGLYFEMGGPNVGDYGTGSTLVHALLNVNTNGKDAGK